MTTNNAIPPRWYMVSKTGVATLCADEVDARENAAVADMNWRGEAPHVAVQLAPVQPAMPADAERLEFILQRTPGDALRYVVGELADTADIDEFRAAIDARRRIEEES